MLEDFDLNDIEFLMSVSEGADVGLFDNPEHYNAEGHYSPPKSEEADTMPMYCDGEEMPPEPTEGLSDYDTAGRVTFWDTVEAQSLYYTPAYRDYRREEHQERHYIASTGEVNRYERVRVRNALRKMRRKNPEYYKAKNREYNRAFYQRNKAAKIAEEKERKARLPDEERKRREREKKRKYRAKQKLIKQQQAILDEVSYDE